MSKKITNLQILAPDGQILEQFVAGEGVDTIGVDWADSESPVTVCWVEVNGKQQLWCNMPFTIVQEAVEEELTL